MNTHHSPHYSHYHGPPMHHHPQNSLHHHMQPPNNIPRPHAMPHMTRDYQMPHEHHREHHHKVSAPEQHPLDHASLSPDHSTSPHNLSDQQDDGEKGDKKYPDYCQTITVRDSNGLVKELVFPKALDLDRPKRARTTFSAEQLYTLEREFQRNQYLVGRERTELSRKLQLSETQVKVWYQNRRTKYKRDKEREAEVSASKAESIAACNILKLLDPGQQSANSSSHRGDNTQTSTGGPVSLGPPPRPPPQYLNPLMMPPIGLHLPHSYFPS